MDDWKAWKETTDIYKFWMDHCDEIINFKDTMLEYLNKDVDALWELCEKMGDAFARDLGADIRKKCTLGSCAEHMWQHTLLEYQSWKQRRSINAGNGQTVADSAARCHISTTVQSKCSQC